MRRTTILACAILLLASGIILAAATQPAEAPKSPQFSGKLADGTKIDFDRTPTMKITFSNGWMVTQLLPGMDRAGRRFSGSGKAGDKNLVVVGVAAPEDVKLTVTVGIGKGAKSESVTLEKTK